MTVQKHPSLQIVRVSSATTHLLENITEDVFDCPIDAIRLKQYLNLANAAMFVAVVDRQVVGQIRGFLHLQPDGPSELYIDNLGVTPLKKRQGLATKLVTAITGWARKEGCEAFWLLTEPDNIEGESFYTALDMERKTSLFFEGDISKAP